MNLQMKICLLLTGFLVSSRGEQKCSELRTWPLYLNGLHCLLTSSYFQQKPLKFNVEDLNDWGKGGKKGIHLTEANHEVFLAIMREHNLCLNQTKLDQTQIATLDRLLKVILDGHVKVEKSCKDYSVRITGTFLRLDELNLTDHISSCNNIKRVEVFAADTFYFNKDFSHKYSDLHLSIAAPHWMLGDAPRQVNLPRGSFLGIYEDFWYPGQLTIRTKDGPITNSSRKDLFFYELAQRNLSEAEGAATNFVRTLQEFQIFMQTSSYNYDVLRESITPFLEKLNPHLKPTIDESIFSSLSYAFYKNAKLTSTDFPMVNPGLDRKTRKLLYGKVLTHSFVLEDTSYNNLVVDMDALLDSIINNLESVENAYSAPLLKRISYLEEDNKAKNIELSIVERHSKQFGIYLRDIIESNLDFIKAWNAEVDEEIAKNAERASTLYYVKEAAGMLSSIALLASLPNFVGKELELRTDRLKHLGERSFCEENKQKGQVNIDLCGIKLNFELSSVSTYSQVEEAFKVQGLKDRLLRVMKFILKYCKEFDDVVVHRAEVAMEGAFEILDLIPKYGNILKLEKHHREAMSFEYQDVKSLWQLAESDIDDVDGEMRREGEKRRQDKEMYIPFWETSKFNIEKKIENCFYFLEEMKTTLKYIFEHERHIWDRRLTIAWFSYALSIVSSTRSLADFTETAEGLLLTPLDNSISALLTHPVTWGMGIALTGDYFSAWHARIGELKSRTQVEGESLNLTINGFEDEYQKTFFPDVKKYLENVQNCIDNIFENRYVNYERLIKEKSIAAECIAKLINSYNPGSRIVTYPMFNFQSLFHSSHEGSFHHEFFKLHDKLGSLLLDIASELTKFKKGLQKLVLDKLPTYKDKAMNRIKNLKVIDSYTKLYTAPFEYNRLINAIKQYTFPLAHVYLTHHDLPKPINVNPIDILERIKKFKYGFRVAGQTLKFEELKHSSLFGFNNFTPFFTWKDSQAIRNLLKGQEVVLFADLHNLDFNAVKFNTIGLNFNANLGLGPDQKFREESQKWLVEMTHQGDSLYNCDGKVYIIRTPAQKFSFSIALKEGTREALITNSVYDEIKNGGYVLSPYASWKVRIFEGLDSNFIKGYLKESVNITIELVGRGQFYENGSQMCSPEDLNGYYESVTDKLEYSEGVGYFKGPMKCSASGSPTLIVRKTDAKEEVEEISY